MNCNSLNFCSLSNNNKVVGTCQGFCSHRFARHKIICKILFLYSNTLFLQPRYESFLPRCYTWDCHIHDHILSLFYITRRCSVSFPSLFLSLIKWFMEKLWYILFILNTSMTEIVFFTCSHSFYCSLGYTHFYYDKIAMKALASYFYTQGL